MASQGPKRTRSGDRPKGQVVLLVEDVTDVRAVLAEILVREGFAVVEASNGHEAVVKARAVRPDAIVVRPMLGGIEAARVIRAIENLHDVPIVALTARPVGTFDEHEFDGVLSKPCLPDVLVRRIQAVIVSRRKRYSPSGAT